MAAAVADGMVPLLPGPRGLASSLSTAASLARACRRLALAAAGAAMRLLLVEAVGDAVLFLCLASAWLLAASLTAFHLGRSACGYDCAVVFAGANVAALSAFSFTALWSPSLLVCIHRVWAAAGDANDEERALAAAAQEVLFYPMFAVLATTPFIPLTLVGGLMNWEKMLSVGLVGIDVIWCFIIIPTAAVRMWRVTRPGWQYEIERTPEENTAVMMDKKLQVPTLHC